MVTWGKETKIAWRGFFFPPFKFDYSIRQLFSNENSLFSSTVPLSNEFVVVCCFCFCCHLLYLSTLIHLSFCSCCCWGCRCRWLLFLLFITLGVFPFPFASHLFFIISPSSLMRGCRGVCEISASCICILCCGPFINRITISAATLVFGVCLFDLFDCLVSLYGFFLCVHA